MVAAVNLAIPSLQASSLHPSASETAWIVDGYILVFACLLIPAGSLGDRFGRKRGMLIGLVVFAVGSVLAALAPSVAVLTLARALTGVGAAFVMPASLAIALGRLAPADRPQGVAVWSALTGIAGALGNVVGGLAVELSGWRLMFWLGAPVALAAAGLIAVAVPDQTPHDDPVDWGGGVLLTAGTVGLIFAIIEAPNLGWGSLQVLGSFALGIITLAALAWYEARIEHPMLDPGLFRLRGVRAGTLGIIALFFALFGLFYLNAQYLQDVKGFSPLLTGVCILPTAFAVPYASARSTRLAGRIGPCETTVLGMLVLTAGLTLLSFATAGTPYPLYGLMLVLIGVGMGLALPLLSGMIVRSVPASHAGVSSGLNSTTRELGSALGVAAFSTILVTRFADRLPAALRDVPGARGEAIQRSVTTALRHASDAVDPAVADGLVHGTREAFTSGISLGLRAGALLLLLATVVVAVQYPDS